MHGRGHAWQGGKYGGDIHGGGLHGRGAGLCGRGAWWGVGACMAGGMHGRGGHAMHTSLTLRDTVSHCAGGTHPTGMHSCLVGRREGAREQASQI